MSASFGKILSTFFSEYSRKTPLKLKVIDIYLVYVVMTGVVQALYCALVGTFPFNSFLSGFISTVGSFVLAVGLRMHVNPQNTWKGVVQERAFADWIFANLLFHFVIISFLG